MKKLTNKNFTAFENDIDLFNDDHAIERTYVHYTVNDDTVNVYANELSTIEQFLAFSDFTNVNQKIEKQDDCYSIILKIK